MYPLPPAIYTWKRKEIGQLINQCGSQSDDWKDSPAWSQPASYPTVRQQARWLAGLTHWKVLDRSELSESVVSKSVSRSVGRQSVSQSVSQLVRQAVGQSVCGFIHSVTQSTDQLADRSADIAHSIHFLYLDIHHQLSTLTDILFSARWLFLNLNVSLSICLLCRLCFLCNWSRLTMVTAVPFKTDWTGRTSISINSPVTCDSTTYKQWEIKRLE